MNRGGAAAGETNCDPIVMLFRHSLSSLLPLKMGNKQYLRVAKKGTKHSSVSSMGMKYGMNRPVHSKSLSTIQCFLGARILFPGPYKADGRTAAFGQPPRRRLKDQGENL